MHRNGCTQISLWIAVVLSRRSSSGSCCVRRKLSYNCVLLPTVSSSFAICWYLYAGCSWRAHRHTQSHSVKIVIIIVEYVMSFAWIALICELPSEHRHSKLRFSVEFSQFFKRQQSERVRIKWSELAAASSCRSAFFFTQNIELLCNFET